MSIRFLLPLVALAMPAAAFAQDGSAAAKSAEDITCELTGDCEQVAVSDANLRDAPESRGFTLRRRITAPLPASPGASYAKPAGEKSSGTYAQSPGRSAPKYSVGHGSRTIDRAAPGKPRSSNLSVGFVTGSAALDASGLRQAKALLEALKGPKLTGKKVVVAGHTDNVGNREYNLDLSQRRAQTMVDYLAQNGVDRATLTAKGYGFDKPLPGTSAANGANRRVEVSLAN